MMKIAAVFTVMVASTAAASAHYVPGAPHEHIVDQGCRVIWQWDYLSNPAIRKYRNSLFRTHVLIKNHCWFPRDVPLPRRSNPCG